MLIFFLGGGGKYNEAFRGISFLFESARKNFKSNLVHVVILLLESQRSLMSYVVRETSFQMFLSFIGEIGVRPQSPSRKMPCQLFE